MPSATSPLTRCNRSVLHLLLSWMIDVLLMLALKSVSLASKDVKDWTPFRSETRRSSLLVRKKSCFLSEMLVVYARFSLYTSCRYFWVLEILLQKLCVTRTCLRDGSYRLKEKKQHFVKSYVINIHMDVKMSNLLSQIIFDSFEPQDKEWNLLKSTLYGWKGSNTSSPWQKGSHT